MRNDVLVYTTPPLTEHGRSHRARQGFALSLVGRQGHRPNDQAAGRPAGRQGVEPGRDASSGFAGARGGTSRCSWSPAKSTRSTSARWLRATRSYPGHRIRIEVSSSNFPHFERNLNTGGNNFDEEDGRRRAQRHSSRTRVIPRWWCSRFCVAAARTAPDDMARSSGARAAERQFSEKLPRRIRP